MNDLINLATRYTLNWISNRNLKSEFSQATSVNELKKLVAIKLFSAEAPNEKFIKGARLVNWEAIYKFVQGMSVVIFLLFFVASVSALEVKVTYKIQSKQAGRSLRSPALTKTSGDSFTGLSIKKTKKNINLATVPAQIQTKKQLEHSPTGLVEQKVCEIFGTDCRIALAICRAESGCREEAVGDGHLTFFKDGVEYGKSYGVFQIRHLPGRPAPEDLLNAEINIRKAYDMYKVQGWGPWSVFTSGRYLQYL